MRLIFAIIIVTALSMCIKCTSPVEQTPTENTVATAKVDSVISSMGNEFAQLVECTMTPVGWTYENNFVESGLVEHVIFYAPQKYTDSAVIKIMFDSLEIKRQFPPLGVFKYIYWHEKYLVTYMSNVYVEITPPPVMNSKLFLIFRTHP